ncbi:hypothetical protein [Microvirga sp. BSC39]|uniref:hypothetical protein n=1 Tax=Microvirga sp. BSC39 TaxID=1549810 RepID=UPI0004E95074|nr:hypothetical protein [Microvirga sp. BSC39]KFG68639.1 hypothetical protein JH26_15930 [Microvirga sp. BSC39]
MRSRPKHVGALPHRNDARLAASVERQAGVSVEMQIADADPVTNGKARRLLERARPNCHASSSWETRPVATTRISTPQY